MSYKEIVFQRADGKLWSEFDGWVDEYPDAFTLMEEDVDLDTLEEHERDQVEKLFKWNPSVHKIDAIFGMGYAYESSKEYTRAEMCPETMSLKQRLLHAGLSLKEKDFDTHESDLYVVYTADTEKWLKEHMSEGDFRQVKAFMSERDGLKWFDIPFGYMPEHFEKKHGNAHRAEQRRKANGHV